MAADAARVRRPVRIVARVESLRRALLIGWAFGVGQFGVGLNWIATAFTFQAAMPPWLGWVAVVLLSLYLASIRCSPRASRGASDATTRWRWYWRSPAPGRSPNGCADRSSPASPGTRSAAVARADAAVTITPLIGTYGLSALVVLLGGAIWLAYQKKWRRWSSSSAHGLAVAAAVLARARRTR